jgi:hypothetical protein
MQLVLLPNSESVPVTTAYDSESVESSCNESGTTSGSNGRYYREEKQLTKQKNKPSKYRKQPVKNATGQVLQDKSVNLSNHSNWDSDWGGNLSMASMDFEKFASVVDEQVSALRDFIGVGRTKIAPRPKNISVPTSPTASVDIEDVAIEVEYVADSMDGVEATDLGFCANPVHDLVRKTLDFSKGSKETLQVPSGPSRERKPSVSKHSKRHAYV